MIVWPSTWEIPESFFMGTNVIYLSVPLTVSCKAIVDSFQEVKEAFTKTPIQL